MKDRKNNSLQDLRSRILSQDIPPGSMLDEGVLCERYSLSRTPMREIFQTLAGEGFLELTRNRGAIVAPMDLATLRVFFQTAPLVYASIARLAAENRRPEQVDALRTIQETFRQATTTGDAQASALSNHQFHEAIGEMAHNPYLLPSLKRMLIDHTRLSQTFYRPKSEDERTRVSTACDQHDQMIDAIAAQDGARAADLTLAHWDLSRDRLERFVTPEPLPFDMTLQKDQTHAV